MVNALFSQCGRRSRTIAPVEMGWSPRLGISPGSCRMLLRGDIGVDGWTLTAGGEVMATVVLGTVMSGSDASVESGWGSLKTMVSMNLSASWIWYRVEIICSSSWILTARLVCWFIRSLVRSLVGSLAGWLVRSLVRWLDGWFVRWSVG